MLAACTVEQDGGRLTLSEITTDSEPAVMRLDEDKDEDDSDGVRMVVDDEFSPRDAH